MPRAGVARDRCDGTVHVLVDLASRSKGDSSNPTAAEGVPWADLGTFPAVRGWVRESRPTIVPTWGSGLWPTTRMWYALVEVRTSQPLGSRALRPTLFWSQTARR